MLDVLFSADSVKHVVPTGAVITRGIGVASRIILVLLGGACKQQPTAIKQHHPLVGLQLTVGSKRIDVAIRRRHDAWLSGLTGISLRMVGLRLDGYCKYYRQHTHAHRKCYQ